MSSKHVRHESVNACVVCCEDIEFYATGSCDHTVCYKCCVRMRVLGRETYCPVCRTELDQVFLTKDRISYQRLTGNCRSFIIDKRHGIWFQKKEIQHHVKELMQHHCPYCPDHPSMRFFDHLREHVRKVHERFYCNLCVAHLRKFTSERKAYTRQELARHRRVGDVDDTSHKGHPLCEFCDERYLDNDELHRHLRKDHFWCHFCERDGAQDYFPNYPSLRFHFRDFHFLCEEGDCVHEQFTSAFRTKVDLQAHRANKHSKNLTKAQARQARQLDVDITFAPRPRTQGNQFGVVSGRDFMEVRAADQRQGKQEKGRAKEVSRETNARRDVLDTMTAMALSESESLSDNPSKLPSSSSKPQEPKKHKSEDKNREAPSSNELLLHFPSLPGSSEGSNFAKASKGQAVAGKSCAYGNAVVSGPLQSTEDFPSLNSADRMMPQQPQSFPPGFAMAAWQSPPLPVSEQTNQAKPPPGLQRPPGVATRRSPPLPASEQTNQAKPPPGLQVPSGVVAHRSPPLSVSEQTKQGKPPPGFQRQPGVAVIEKTKENIAPSQIPSKPEVKLDSIQERNQALVDKIRRLLSYDRPKYDEFRALSGKFRQGACSAQEYYSHCCDLFGPNFSQVFLELVDLLPDSEKQKQLLVVHQDTKVKEKQKGEQHKTKKTHKNPPQTGVWSAPAPIPQYEKPRAVAISEQDFPALPAASRRSYQPSYRAPKSAAVLKEAWIRGK